MIQGFTAVHCAINVAVKAFRQSGEEVFFSFAKWETVSPMPHLAISSASLDYECL